MRLRFIGKKFAVW